MSNNPKRNTIADAMKAENITPLPPHYNYGYPAQQLQRPQTTYYFQQPHLYQSQSLFAPKVSNQQIPLQSQQQQSSHPQFLPPVDESELDQPTRWESDLKVYSYLYRKLGIHVPNLASARFCSQREVFTEQTSILVKQYVERAFEKCQSDEERNQMEQYLKATIAEAKRKSEYHTRDWSRFPLPTLPRENQIRTSTIFPTSLGLKSSTTAIMQSIQTTTAKFGAPSTAPPAGLAQKLLASIPHENLMSYYDSFKQKQVESFNYNNLKQKPFESTMDFMMLQASKLQPNAQVQIKQQQKQLKKKFDEEDKVELAAKIIGSCEDLEKPYYRLTGLPDPSTIRPEHVLRKSLQHILRKWKASQCDYNFIQEQFRSIRQDLLVQHIQNHFTVQVYEENARICIECGDFARYESCWTMLCDLYEMISISEGKDVNQIGNKVEFDSYRIVYLTMLNKQDQIVKILHHINNDAKIKFALDIRESYKIGNYVKLFQDYKEAPETMSRVIGHFLIRIRIKALRLIVKTYISNVNLAYLADLLSFTDVEQFKQFLQYFDLVRFDENLENLHVKHSFNAFDNINFEKLNE